MPQSLTVGGSSSSGSSSKRQRSADSREVQTRQTSVNLNRSTSSLSKPTMRIPSYLDKTKAEIQQAFQDIEWKQRFRLSHALENPATSPYRMDRSEIVISRNRYGNVQPWDNSRVKLTPPIGGSDYVNASPITVRSRGLKDGSMDGNGVMETLKENKYIATQGPKDSSMTHFWHMVMQETTGDTGVIVMLTQCYEAYKEKCSQYFPASINNPVLVLHPEGISSFEEDKENQVNRQSLHAASQDSVTLRSIDDDSSTGSRLRILDLTINSQTKTIYHYLFHGWPDFGRPEAEDRVALLELIRQTRKIAGDSPRIVHCSAGVGRTGTFIALDFLTNEIEDGRIHNYSQLTEPSTPLSQVVTPTLETWGRSGPPKVKTPTGEFPSGEENSNFKDDLIYETVNSLRDQRMMMVMNELQYSFLYEVAREVFLEKYKARPEGAVVKSAEAESTDFPKGKVLRVEGDDSGSGSEAETEIMDGDENAKKSEVMEKMEREGDPYNVVAPEYIREGIAKGER